MRAWPATEPLIALSASVDADWNLSRISVATDVLGGIGGLAFDPSPLGAPAPPALEVAVWGSGGVCAVSTACQYVIDRNEKGTATE